MTVNTKLILESIGSEDDVKEQLKKLAKKYDGKYEFDKKAKLYVYGLERQKDREIKQEIKDIVAGLESVEISSEMVRSKDFSPDNRVFDMTFYVLLPNYRKNEPWSTGYKP